MKLSFDSLRPKPRNDDVDDDDDDDAVMGVGWLGSCWYDHWLVS